MLTKPITSGNYPQFLEELRSLADPQYRAFHLSLVPTEEQDRLLGVRMPVLRALAKSVAWDDPRGFLRICGDDYYEERILRAIVSGRVKPADAAELCALIDAFLPYVSSWAVCDCFCAGLKAVKRHRDAVFAHIGAYLDGDVWAQRVALVLMLSYYLDDAYIDRVLTRVDSVRSGEYYVRMAQAWLLATALVKCPQPVLAYFEHNALDDFTHNKAIQKAIESYRVDDATKNYLRTLKRP